MNQEESFIQSFIEPDRQELWLHLYGKSRDRIKRRLARCAKELDKRYAKPIPTEQQSIDELVKLFGALGGSSCYAISECGDIDGEYLDFRSALNAIMDRGMGTLLCLRAGELAYYEGAESGERYMCIRSGG